MDHQRDRQNLRPFLWSAFVAILSLFVAGCQRENSQDYQSFQEKRQSGYVPLESFPADDDAPESEPLLAEVEPEANEANSAQDRPVSALAPLNVVDGSNVGDILRAVTTSGGDAAVIPPAGGVPGENVPKTPRKIELLVKEREFRAEGPQGALRVTYDDLDLLKILNMEPVTPDAARYFPRWLRQLDGQRIRIRGFMMPTFESTGLERFVLARDAALCCFGPNPKVYDLIAVEMKPGTTCDYIHLRPFDVVGTLKIDLVAEGSKPLGLYWIEDAEIVQK
jgi:hypothetical protein